MKSTLFNAVVPKKVNKIDNNIHISVNTYILEITLIYMYTIPEKTTNVTNMLTTGDTFSSLITIVEIIDIHTPIKVIINIIKKKQIFIEPS